MASLVRIYLTGRVAIEATRLVDEFELPGAQTRVLLAVLALSRGPISRSRVASILWDGHPPSEYDRSLNPLLSKLRHAFVEAGADRDLVASGTGSLEIRRSAGMWIDVEAATTALDAAEGALRRDDPEAAWPRAAVATSILGRPFLEGVELAWADEQRRTQHEGLVRAYECAADVWMALGEAGQAVVAARRLIEADHFRETSHERLIRAHLLAGNRAEALLAFGECERILRDELGVAPSPRVQAAYEEALTAEA